MFVLCKFDNDEFVLLTMLKGSIVVHLHALRGSVQPRQNMYNVANGLKNEDTKTLESS